MDYSADVPGQIKDYLKDGDIKILYRDKIRVFFDTVSDAKKHEYYDFNKKDFPKDSCILYGYTGLRGDAKKMYLDWR